MVDLPIAWVALFIAAFGAIIEVLSIRAIDKRLQREHDYIENRGTVGEQFGEYLEETEDGKPAGPENPTRLQAWSHIIGQTVFQSGRMSDMQAKSVGAKIQNRYDQEVREGVKHNMTPKMKMIWKIAEKLGFDPDEIIEKGELTEFLQALKNNGVDESFASSGGGSSNKNLSGLS